MFSRILKATGCLKLEDVFYTALVVFPPQFARPAGQQLLIRAKLDMHDFSRGLTKNNFCIANSTIYLCIGSVSDDILNVTDNNRANKRASLSFRPSHLHFVYSLTGIRPCFTSLPVMPKKLVTRAPLSLSCTSLSPQGRWRSGGL